MKQSFFLIAIALSVCAVCTAQKGETDDKKTSPPATAKLALAKAFPGSSSVKWTKEDGNYEAEFKQQGKSMSAVFDGKGSLLETEEPIKEGALPAAALQFVKDKYKGAKIKEAAKVTQSNGEVSYEAELSKKDVMFDATGKFIKEIKH